MLNNGRRQNFTALEILQHNKIGQVHNGQNQVNFSQNYSANLVQFVLSHMGSVSKSLGQIGHFFDNYFIVKKNQVLIGETALKIFQASIDDHFFTAESARVTKKAKR